MTVASRLGARIARLRPAETYDVSVERDVAVKMADGAVLLADHWYPSSSTSPPPIVLIRTPYGRRQLGIVGRLFAERGYQTVIQSCRGTFGSEGAWDPFRHEREDGQHTLEWLTAQPWFCPSVGTWGASYLGLTQWSVAATAPPFLRAMALDVTASNFAHSVVYPGGSFALETSLTWAWQLAHQEGGLLGILLAERKARKVLAPAYGRLPLCEADRAALGTTVPFFQDWVGHAGDDAWWAPVDFSRDVTQMPPATLVAGWYDPFLADQVDDFVALKAAGRQARLTIGPWTHVSLVGGATSVRDGLSWFDEHLRGRPPADRLPVRLYVMGTKRWVELPDWPPPARAQSWYIHGGGQLGLTPAVTSEPDRYRYDPADPTPLSGGLSLSRANSGRKDNRTREARADVLCFTSAALGADVTVAGPITAQLYVRSTRVHTDVFVRLCDVDERGRSANVSDGIVRLGPDPAGPTAPRPDGSRLVRIRMSPTANTFRRGHRIRLQVSSGAHPVYARNPGTGEPLATATTMLPADQEVFHDPEHPSAVELPMWDLPRL